MAQRAKQGVACRRSPTYHYPGLRDQQQQQQVEEQQLPHLSTSATERAAAAAAAASAATTGAAHTPGVQAPAPEASPAATGGAGQGLQGLVRLSRQSGEQAVPQAPGRLGLSCSRPSSQGSGGSGGGEAGTAGAGRGPRPRIAAVGPGQGSCQTDPVRGTTPERSMALQQAASAAAELYRFAGITGVQGMRVLHPSGPPPAPLLAPGRPLSPMHMPHPPLPPDHKPHQLLVGSVVRQASATTHHRPGPPQQQQQEPLCLAVSQWSSRSRLTHPPGAPSSPQPSAPMLPAPAALSVPGASTLASRGEDPAAAAARTAALARLQQDLESLGLRRAALHSGQDPPPRPPAPTLSYPWAGEPQAEPPAAGSGAGAGAGAAAGPAPPTALQPGHSDSQQARVHTRGLPAQASARSQAPANSHPASSGRTSQHAQHTMLSMVSQQGPGGTPLDSSSSPGSQGPGPLCGVGCGAPRTRLPRPAKPSLERLLQGGGISAWDTADSAAPNSHPAGLAAAGGGAVVVTGGGVGLTRLAPAGRQPWQPPPTAA
ncbi:hypothetical protein V8C86DRAFT_20490 [Haematococcus lacustris]